MENITTEEKIDYIYKKLRKKEKNKKIKLFLKYFFRLLFFAFLIYIYYFGINHIINGVKKSIMESLNSKKENSLEFVKDKFSDVKDFIKRKNDNNINNNIKY